MLFILFWMPDVYPGNRMNIKNGILQNIVIKLEFYYCNVISNYRNI